LPGSDGPRWGLDRRGKDQVLTVVTEVEHNAPSVRSDVDRAEAQVDAHLQA